MSFKALFRSIVALAILFVMLYLGMNNTQDIPFYFPLLLKTRLIAPAGMIYFGVFAVGVIGGTILTVGGGGGKRGGGGKDR